MRGRPRHVAAIGRATAEALGGADLVPAVSTQEGLLEALPRPAGRVLFAGAEDARPLLAERARRRRGGALPHAEAAAGGLPSRRRRGRARVRVRGGGVRRARPDRARDLDRAADNRRGTRRRRQNPRRGADARRRRPPRGAPGMVITFLTDFGLSDDFVGVCHGVMKRIAPESPVIDITHGIPPQAVLQGALVLANTVPYMPEGVHLAVVDPGVGGGRRPLALRDASGRLYVGPDNGLLIPAAEANGGVAEARELTNPDYALPSVSRTFHGRDLFAPAAAHLSKGVDLAELGPPVATDALVRLDLPVPVVGDDPHARDDPLRRHVRERPAQPDARAPRARRRRARHDRRARRRPGPLLRGRGTHVRRHASRRPPAVRGQLPEHLARDQPRQRSGDPQSPRRPRARDRPRAGSSREKEGRPCRCYRARTSL